ncbi:hypothetical protein D9M71_387540 [compost metagenome]
MLDQWFFQRADHQLHAGGLCLAVEIIQRGHARAVEHFDDRWFQAGLLGLEVGGHEAFAQGAGNRCQLAFLGQQQGDLGQGLAGQFLELDQ